MEWCYYALILILICSLFGKLDDISKKIVNIESNKNGLNKLQKNLLLDEYIGKKVTLEIDNNDIENDYLFETISAVEGEIIEYDDEWLLFRYYHKQQKKTIEQYLRRRDLVSINEINSD